MLHELHLRGLGVIAEASVELAPGLNVVTGETGVGKTLLVTSLALLTGSRGHSRLVTEGCREAVVQAVATPSDATRAELARRGIEPEGDLIIVRRLSADGRSRASVDGQLVPVSALSDIGETLLEMHGQGAGFALARPAAQLAAIDALARNDDLLSRYRAALDGLRLLERERDQLMHDEAGRAREVDLLAYQIDEIERASLRSDEDETLPGAIARLEHAERLGEIGAEASALVGADGAAGELAAAHQLLASAARLDPDATGLMTRIADVAAETADLAQEIRAWAEGMEADPPQLEALRERKALLATLKRKYGATVEDVLAFAAQSRRQLDALLDSTSRIGTIDAEVSEARAAVDAVAAELTERRKRACDELTRLVCDELPALALPKAVFVVDHASVEPGESGADKITFRFSSSRARTPEDIGKIASGGELSRAMIAVTLALAQTHGTDVLVFDEADAGVGGEAALELGRRLQRLGRTHQVLVVSHLPQIAAFADRHVAVRRNGDAVSVDVLGEGDRLTEISRMLAGLGSSSLARAHASELLELASSERGRAVSTTG